MNKKQKIQTAVVCVLFLALGVYLDYSDQGIGSDRQISRGKIGELTKQILLIVNAEGILKNHEYALSVEPEKADREEAEKLFQKAVQEIDTSFCQAGEDCSHVTEKVCIADSYVDGVVAAEWSFSNETYISRDGNILEDTLQEEGALIEAQVSLSIGAYTQMYQFPFFVFPKTQTKEEAFLEKIANEIDKQQVKEGQSILILPEEVDGTKLSWKKKREYFAIKFAILEAVIFLLFPFLQRERKKTEIKKRQKELLLQYPDLISKLTVLLGAGMSMKQAWNRISARYLDKREKENIIRSELYEEMLRTNREICDGESERIAYQRFAERTGVYTYYRFVRLLIQNLQKGNGGLCELLSLEAETAFEERRLLARKMGEEAGTKMLMPLILMMGIVMAIVVMPAILGFT